MNTPARGIVSGEAGETEGLDPKGQEPGPKDAPRSTDGAASHGGDTSASDAVEPSLRAPTERTPLPDRYEPTDALGHQSGAVAEPTGASDPGRQGGIFAGKTPDNVVMNGDDLDAAIDAAIAAAATPEGKSE